MQQSGCWTATSWHRRGTSCYAFVSQSNTVMKDVSEVTSNFELSHFMVFFFLSRVFPTVMHAERLLSVPSLSSFALASSASSRPHLASTLSSLSSFSLRTVPPLPLFINPSSRCAFHRTLRRPLLSFFFFFSESQQLVSFLWHQGPDRAPACSQGGCYLAVFGEKPSVSSGEDRQRGTTWLGWLSRFKGT